MSTAKAERWLLQRLAAGSTALLAILLALPARPAWADGVDAEGRTVLLIGAHQLGDTPEAKQAVAAVLESFVAGELPEGVHAVAYAPKASEAFAEIVSGAGLEVLCDGPRGSGKTQLVPAALAALAEVHARGGFALPLRVLWLHGSLTDAGVKTGRSLEHPLWGGLWSIRDDRRVAVLTVGGAELVVADSVGTRDESAAERLRAECHVVAAEELIHSLDDSGGIDERRYDLGRSSQRLETRRRVAICTTNPGDVTTWPHRRWIEGGGQAGAVRCQIPASDRLTTEEVAALRQAFQNSPDLSRRLADGEWAGVRLGVTVAEGYDPTVHVAAGALRPSPDHLLAIGFDGGHTPSAVIGQLVGGQVRIFASINAMDTGVLELLEDQLVPWLVINAPWARSNPRMLVSIIDPSMRTTSEATVRISSEKTIRDVLGCRVESKFSNLWPPRREAVLRLVAPRHEGGNVPLAISPTSDTTLLRQSLSSRWYYRQTPDGRVDRSGPRKPNSPWADVGDAFAYLGMWLRPGSRLDAGPVRRPTVKSEFNAITHGRPGAEPIPRRTWI